MNAFNEKYFLINQRKVFDKLTFGNIQFVKYKIWWTPILIEVFYYPYKSGSLTAKELNLDKAIQNKNIFCEYLHWFLQFPPRSYTCCLIKGLCLAPSKWAMHSLGHVKYDLIPWSVFLYARAGERTQELLIGGVFSLTLLLTLSASTWSMRYCPDSTDSIGLI
jgi:hypothetical protein